MDKRDKRGLLLLRQIIEIIIAVIVIGLIIYAGIVLFRTYFGKPQEMQAKGTLDRITQVLAEVNESGKSSSLLLTAPAGWYIVGFDAEHNENSGYRKPGFFGQNCVCICKRRLFERACKSEICRAIAIPLMQAEKQALVKIEIVEVYFMNMKDYYNVSFKPAQLAELSEEERIAALAYRPSNTAIDEWLEEQESPLAGLGQCVEDISARTEIPVSVILAVAAHESNWGNSELAQNCNNLFGIKSEKGECRMATEEYVDGARTVTASFERYGNKCLSIAHFGKLISTSPQYEEAMLVKDDPTQMLYTIHGCSGPYAGQACIYATDPEWADKVIAIANQIPAEV